MSPGLLTPTRRGLITAPGLAAVWPASCLIIPGANTERERLERLERLERERERGSRGESQWRKREGMGKARERGGKRGRDRVRDDKYERFHLFTQPGHRGQRLQAKMARPRE